MNSLYLTSAQKASQLPTFEFPEVAFIGRSNCGKSSLLNSLLERKNLARSSSTPGRTQMVNFFSIEKNKDEKMIFVDLPGYGFNVARKEIRTLWNDLLSDYLKRPQIVEFLFLSDVRRDFEDFEWDYMKKLSDIIPIRIVFTKCDKVNTKDAQKRKQDTLKQIKELDLSCHGIFLVSNLKKSGVSKLRDELFTHFKTVSQ